MPDDSRDPYELLGVAPAATPAKMQQAYRRRVVVAHRTRVLRLVEHLEELKLAYETLTDPTRRRALDAAQREASLGRAESTRPDTSTGVDRHRREGDVRIAMARGSTPSHEDAAPKPSRRHRSECKASDASTTRARRPMRIGGRGARA